MADELPRSIGSSTITIMGVELVAHVLDNGQRIFEAEGFERLLGVMFGGEYQPTEEELTELARIVHRRFEAR